jgi:hypothetical protein
MFSATPLHTTTPFGCGSSFIVIPDDTDTESDITMAQETQELNISRRDRDPTGGTRDRFIGSRDTVSRNSADAAAAVAQREEMRRGRALGSEYSWHQQTFKLAVVEQLPKKASGLLLLGRTPSGCDYAQDMEEEDAATLISDASSYCARPTRMQMIHRPIPALFQEDEERDTEDLPDAENDADQNTEEPQLFLPPAALVHDDSREESPKPMTRNSDGHQRDGLMRGNAQQRHQNVGSSQFQTDTTGGRITFSPPGKYNNLSTGEQDWLEMEPENPADACGSCMGYSLLDFLVPAATYSTSRRRGQRSRTSKHRLPRSTLPLNTVEEATEEGGSDAFFVDCSPRVAPTRRKSELVSTTPRLKQKKDPVGDYEDPVGTYSSLVY